MVIGDDTPNGHTKGRLKDLLSMSKDKLALTLMLEHDRTLKQAETIAKLKTQLSRDPNEKLSPCCGETLIKYISLNKKVCYACRNEYPWNLDPGQKPLFQRRNLSVVEKEVKA